MTHLSFLVELSLKVHRQEVFIKQLTEEEIQRLHQNLVLIFKQLDAWFGLFYAITHLSVSVCVYLCGGDEWCPSSLRSAQKLVGNV